MKTQSLRISIFSRVSRYLLPAFTFATGLQLLAVFIPGLAWYLRDTEGVATLQLLPYAFTPFLLAFLAAVLRRWAGARTSLWVTAGGVALLRMAEQISTQSRFDLWFSIAGLTFFFMFIPVFIGHIRMLGAHTAHRWVYGFVLGFAVDLALRIAFGSRQLSTVSGALPIALVLLMVAVILWALWREPAIERRGVSDVNWRAATTLIAFGPFLVLQVLIFGSYGYLGEVSRLSPGLSQLLIMLGYFASCAGINLGFARPHALHPLIAFVMVIFLGGSAYFVDQSGLILVLVLLLGQAVMGWGWAVIGIANTDSDREGLARSTVMVGIGLLLFLVLVFGYYVAQDIAFPFPRAGFPAVAGGILGFLFMHASINVRSRPATTSRHASALIAMGVLLVIPLLSWILLGSESRSVESDGEQLHVMTYNIHSGFNLNGQQDLEAIAAVIEASGADVVGLQEVSRARFMDAAADLPGWLARHLDMNYVFRGTEEPIWGNAILSRYPILESGWGELPRAGKLIGRGYLWARIDAGGPQPVLVIATHLHHLGPDSLARQEQVPTLLEFWDDQPSSILLGDLNAEPGSPEMALIAEAGLQDAWSESVGGPGCTFSSGDPVKRIDWIWHTEDLEPVSITVIQTKASDHMPVLATFNLEANSN